MPELRSSCVEANPKRLGAWPAGVRRKPGGPAGRMAAGPVLQAGRHEVIERFATDAIIPLLLARQRARLQPEGHGPAGVMLALASIGRIAPGGAASASTGACEDEKLAIIAAAARHLGRLWVEDSCSFAEVTLGCAELHRRLRALPQTGSRPAPGALRGLARRRRMALFAVPGEQHRLGVAVLARAFAQAGWSVCQPAVPNLAALAPALAGGGFDLVGISCGADMHLETMARCIATVQQVAERRPAILGGGPALLAQPALVGQLGLDGSAADAAEAVRLAWDLCSPAASGGWPPSRAAA